MKFRKTGDKKNPVRTALVLSGGGAKGAYQVGVIKELCRQGIKIDLVTGSSIGAFNGALMAEFINSGLDFKETACKLEKVWQEVTHILSLNWSGFVGNLFNPLLIPSIFTNREVKKILAKYISKERKFFDYTDCQLSVTGTNLNTRDLHIFDFNSDVTVNNAVLASMAYPVAYPSMKIDNNYYIDGGFLDNTPLKEAILWGARKIYVVFLTPLSIIKGEEEGKDKDESFYSAVKVIDSVIDIAGLNLMYGDLKQARKINKLIRIINRYEKKLPPDFVDELRELYGLKPEGEKRIVYINRIAPEKSLNPPGTMGFGKRKILQELIKKGQKRARKCL